MSIDRAALAALQTQTNQELRFFELVTLRFSAQSMQCFFCVGKHCVYLVRRNVAGLYPSDRGGQIYYAHIEQLVEDSQSMSDLVMVMNENRPTDWQSEKLFIVSEHRMKLIEHMTVAWQTDYAWRFGKVGSLPLNQQALRRRPQAGLLKALPFQGHQEVSYEGYNFFLRDSYRSEVNAMAGHGAGVLYDDERELELRLKVDEPENLAEIEISGRDHIRWVAAQYRSGVTANLNHVLLVTNQFYSKKMNLANDIASWTGWEIFLKSESLIIAAVFLRRQYVPPLLDCAQDFMFTITCPSHSLSEGIVTEAELLHEVRMVADTCTPHVHNCTQHQQIYRRMVQAKLDTLLVNEDSLVWLDVSLDMAPVHQRDAKRFLKSILKILQDENELKTPTLIHQIGEELIISPDPMAIPRQLLGILCKADKSEDLLGSNDPLVNSGYARIGRYLAHCVDGGLLETRFTLFDLTNPDLVSGPSQQKINEILYFFLHIRHKDMAQPYDKTTGVRHHLHESNFFQDFTFNDRVMQSLLELGWIAKQLPVSHSVEQDRRAGRNKSISIDYAKFLAQLLISGASSANLKAAVCRQIITASHEDVHHTVLLPALVDLLNQHSLYLRTYGTVTLVNMSGGQELVKNAIMMWNVVPLILENLQSQDDDLIQYTLALLTNLTKTVQHRHIVSQYNLVRVVLVLLGSMRFNLTKDSILAELCSVLGQLCNDEEMWAEMCKKEHNTIERLLHIFGSAHPGGRLRSKVMFALKQVVARPSWRKEAGEVSNKELVGKIIPKVVQEELICVMRIAKGEDLDCAANAIFLLSTLAILQENVREMQKLSIEVKEVFTEHRGHISEGGDIFTGRMTVDEAKLKCHYLVGCKGFTFVGSHSQSSSGTNQVPIVFKNKCDIVEARGHVAFKFDVKHVPAALSRKGAMYSDEERRKAGTREIGIGHILSRLMESELGMMDSTRDRLAQLFQRVDPEGATAHRGANLLSDSPQPAPSGQSPSEGKPPSEEPTPREGSKQSSRQGGGGVFSGMRKAMNR